METAYFLVFKEKKPIVFNKNEVTELVKRIN